MPGKFNNAADDVEVFARVLIPPRDKLAIGLVPSDFVYRLEEYRADERRWESVMWAFVGAILGIIANWVTNEPLVISRASIILIVILGGIAVLAFSAAGDYKKRANTMKEDLLSFQAVEGGSPDIPQSSSATERISVTVISAAGGHTVVAKVPTYAAMSRLVPALIRKMGLEDLSYTLQHKDTGKTLGPSESLRSAGIKDGDILYVVPLIASNRQSMRPFSMIDDEEE